MSIARDCLAYLFHFDTVGSLTYNVFSEYPLVRYVAHDWTAHARVAEKEDHTLCQELFLTTGEAFINWIRLHHYSQEFDPMRPPKEIAAPLYYASLAGLLESVRLLLDEGVEVNNRASDHISALEAAVEVNNRASDHISALEAAVSEGHVDIVELLLGKSTHISKDNYWGFALEAATKHNHINVVQMLLKNGAGVNMRCNISPHNLWHALLKAIENCNEDIAQLLIKDGADDVCGQLLERESCLEEIHGRLY